MPLPPNGIVFVALQEAFKVPLVVQLTDDEKFLFKPELKLEEVGDLRPRASVVHAHVASFQEKGCRKVAVFFW